MENYNFNFECILVKEAEGFSAICIDVGVASDADTAEDAKKNLEEAVELYLEDTIESNLPILRPIPMDENPLDIKAEEIVERFYMKVKLDLSIHV